MEREVMLTGIGGQGVQLAAQTLARAAVLEGRSVMLFGVYGGMMRGGNTDSSVVVADGPIESPPLLSRTWAALLMHHKFWEPLAGKIRDGGVVAVNSSLFEADLERDRYLVIDIAATDAAAALGAPMTASMVLLGAFVGATRLVGVDTLVAAMTESLPPYRRQHAIANEEALRHGFGLAPSPVAPAWEPASV